MSRRHFGSRNSKMSSSSSSHLARSFQNFDGHSNKIQEYKDALKSQAEHLILYGFPETIIALNELLESPNFKDKSLWDLHEDVQIPVPDPAIFTSDSKSPPPKRDTVAVDGLKIVAFPCGEVSVNKGITQLVEIVKPHIRKLVEDTNLLKMWILVMIPKIEDGNNFGVSIQEETLAEVRFVNSEAAAYYENLSRYYLTRAKLVSKVAKYPHIQDYRFSVREVDEKQFITLWLILSEIRNHYCSLHDIVVKNIEKIKKPRSKNPEEYLY